MTPVLVVTVRGTPSLVLLVIMWALTAVALLTHLVWMHAPELLVGSTYAGLGCMGVIALPSVWMHSGVLACVLITTGGVLYLLGAALYYARRPDRWPSVFGYHEVFHVFVCAGATLHYVAITCLIL